MFDSLFLQDAISRGAGVLRVAVNPAKTAAVIANYEATLLNELDFKVGEVAGALGVDLAPLLQVHPSGLARFWGASEGNRNYVARAKPGDVVIFAGDGYLWGIGEIGVRFDNLAFSEQVWEEYGNPFPIAYSLVEVELGLQLPLRRANLARYSDPNSPGHRPIHFQGADANEILSGLLQEVSSATGGSVTGNAPPHAPASGSMQPPASGQPVRAKHWTERIVRSTAITQYVKSLYAGQCQFCGVVLSTPSGNYSEGAHIRGLGKPHNGPDDVSNVLCLCPNDHALFDSGAIYVNGRDVYTSVDQEFYAPLRVNGQHDIDPAHFDYHRQAVANVN